MVKNIVQSERQQPWAPTPEEGAVKWCSEHCYLAVHSGTLTNSTSSAVMSSTSLSRSLQSWDDFNPFSVL